MILYHATAVGNVPSILRDGLIPRKSKGGDSWLAGNGSTVMTQDRRTDSVYLTDLQHARAFAAYPATVAGTDAAILRVDIPESEVDKLIDDEAWESDAYRYIGTIPASWIKVAVSRYTLEQSKHYNETKHLVREIDMDSFDRILRSLFS